MPKAEPLAASAPASPDPRRAAALAIRARLPRYYTDKDLLAALGSRDALVEAYCHEWLPPEALTQLEERPERLQCWLLARLVRQGHGEIP